MKNLMNRMWRCNPVFSFLFLLSFSMVILLMLYGMTRMSRYMTYRTNLQESSYQSSIRFATGTEEKKVEALSKCPEITGGNLFCSITIPVAKDRYELSNTAWLLVQQHENLKEKLQWGELPLMEEELVEPTVLIGEGLERYSFCEGDNRYLYLGELKCRVRGIYANGCLPYNDTRLMLLKSSLKEADYTYLLQYEADGGAGGDLVIHICSDLQLQQKDIDSVRTYMKSCDGGWYFSESPIIYMTYLESDEMELGRSAVMYLYAFLMVCILGLICICAITLVWSKIRRKEWMIFLINGYSMKRILGKTMVELLCYEGMAMLVAVPCWWFWATIQKIYNAQSVLRWGLPFMFVILLLLPVVLAFFSLCVVARTVPRAYLQTE